MKIIVREYFFKLNISCHTKVPLRRQHSKGPPFLPYNGKKLGALEIMAFKSIQNLRIQMKNEVNELMLQSKSLCIVVQQLTCDSSSPFWEDATKEKRK